MIQKSQKKYSEVFEKLSPDLLRLVVSEETPIKISEICLRNGVEEEEKIEAIAYQIGQVLLGRLPPDEFQKTIEKELKLLPPIAKKISGEINLNIFTLVKDSLDKVYGKEIAPPAKPKVAPPPKIPGEKPPTPPSKDVYREPIE